ncbi:hypothetical protein TraAM80_00372 [Trypanosoma rangeli]|uniref:Uncharacterized protein n=1 Tax=Trypanosoma rangeli TaxID=5698 RepID=A0A3R7KRW5_TRYRA|nr:uncharacterized protein TraAM80_00372 [Trypanosoma rangeli]RNF12361.1 hypothetical protein TraAM80_00372 [Trypanosoma rangeli]|eukprot:RNF12361.1 hypothetical protein TraAM80_00372 [Trypanosoma rangeli]
MTFSERDAILNDEEEWVNIPTVLRRFLRQLNNELENNRLNCDAFLENQKDHDHLIKGILSKQLERELEMKKTELTLQQECHDVQTSFSGVLESIRAQVRHLSEEQQQVRDRIRLIEGREHDTVVLHDSVREELKALPKTMNQRSMALERMMNNTFEELSSSVEELKKKVDLISERQGVGVVETRKELEVSNVAWRQLSDAVSEEMKNLRVQFKHYEADLRELKSFQTESEGESRKLAKAYTHLHEKIHDNLGMVKQLETSSESRFEAVFSALDKSQVLAEKLSRLHHKRKGDEASLMTVVKKTQDMYNALTEDLKKSFVMQSTQHKADFERLNRRIDELCQFKAEVDALVHEKNEDIMPLIEEFHRRIDSIESMIHTPNLAVEIERIAQELIASERMGQERKYTEIHQFLSQEKNAVQDEIKSIRTTVGLLDDKCESTMNLVKKLEIMENNIQTLGKQVRDYEESMDCVRKDLSGFTMDVKTLQETCRTGFYAHNNNDASHIMITQGQEAEKYVPEAKFFEMKTSVRRAEEQLNLHTATLTEMKQHISRVELLVREVPRTCQRYQEALDKKLSPALLQLEVLQRRIASLEVKHAADESREGMRQTLTTLPDGSELEVMRVGVRNDQTLQFAHRKLQEADVRLDSFQLFCNKLERRMEELSREIADVSNKNTSSQRDEEQQEGALQNELKRVLTQAQELEGKVRFCTKGVASGEHSLRLLTCDVRELEASVARVSELIVALERSVSSCITIDSDEWRSVHKVISKFSRCKLNQRLRKLEKEYETFNPLEQVRLAEEALSQIRSEQQAFKQYLDEVQALILQKLSVETPQESPDDVNQPRCALEERVNVVEAAVSELRAKESSVSQSLLSLPSLAMMSEISAKLAAMGDRLTSMESVIATMQGQEADAVAGVKDSVLQERLSALESLMVACQRDMEENSRLLIACQGRMNEREERLMGDDSSGGEKAAVTVPSNDALEGVLERLQRVEFTTQETQKHMSDQAEDVEHRVKSYVDARFEGFWRTTLAATTRKADREEVENKVKELLDGLREHTSLQLNSLKRELQSVIDERVSITEVRELLQGGRESAALSGVGFTSGVRGPEMRGGAANGG